MEEERKLAVSYLQFVYCYDCVGLFLFWLVFFKVFKNKYIHLCKILETERGKKKLHIGLMHTSVPIHTPVQSTVYASMRCTGVPCRQSIEVDR